MVRPRPLLSKRPIAGSSGKLVAGAVVSPSRSWTVLLYSMRLRRVIGESWTLIFDGSKEPPAPDEPPSPSPGGSIAPVHETPSARQRRKRVAASRPAALRIPFGQHRRMVVTCTQ